MTSSRQSRRQGASQVAVSDVSFERNDQTVKDLEEEVLALKNRVQQIRGSQGLPLDESQGSAPRSLAQVTEEVQRLEQLVKENELLSGIVTSDCGFSVIEQDDSSSVREHTITGETRGKPFSLKFEVRENLRKVDQGETQAEVLSIDVGVTEDMNAHLPTNLQEVAARCSLREMVQLLSSYGAWAEDRDKVVNHFAATYPDTVRRDDAGDRFCSASLVITPQGNKGLELRVVWGLEVRPMQSVVPDIQLLAEASHKVLKKDTKGTLKAAPENFKLMLKKFGVESAILMLVKLVDGS